MPRVWIFLMVPYPTAEHFRFRMAKAVNRLLNVTDNKKISLGFQKVNEPILERAHILIFVHEYQRKKFLIAFPHGGLDRRFVREKPVSQKKKVLKIIRGKPSFLGVHHCLKAAYDAHKFLLSLLFFGRAGNLENAFIPARRAGEIIKTP